MIDQLFTVNQVAERLRLSADFIRREIRSGRLQHQRIGARSIRITEDQLLDWMNSRRDISA